MKRQLLGAALLAALVFAPAQPVVAHGGNGGAASDYRIEATGFEGDSSGIEVRPVELGDRMELVRTTAGEVQIVGYEGEPYLRLDADGVFENHNSPAHYTNLDRFARTPTPATASAAAEPRRQRQSDGDRDPLQRLGCPAGEQLMLEHLEVRHCERHHHCRGGDRKPPILEHPSGEDDSAVVGSEVVTGLGATPTVTTTAASIQPVVAEP